MTPARFAIAMFCIWHMTAIGVESLSTSWGISALSAVKNALFPFTHGYVLATSQWQRWDLFSPDPLRRVTRYSIERGDGGGWRAEPIMDARIHSWPLRMLRRLEDARPGDVRIARLLALACREAALPPGTPVRFERRAYEIPNDPGLTSPAWWMRFEPEWIEQTIGQARCEAET